MYVSASWSPPPFSSLSSIGTLRFTFFSLLDFEEEGKGIFLKPVRSWLDCDLLLGLGWSERARERANTL